MKHKQLWLPSNSTWHVFMQMANSAKKMPHSNLTNPPLFIAVLYIKNDQEIWSAVFLINISHTTCIYTHYNHIKPLDSHFNPSHAWIGHKNNLPW